MRWVSKQDQLGEGKDPETLENTRGRAPLGGIPASGRLRLLLSFSLKLGFLSFWISFFVQGNELGKPLENFQHNHYISDLEAKTRRRQKEFHMES